MRERIAELLATVRAWWGRLSRRAKIILLATTAGLLVLALALVIILNRTKWVLLYSDLSPRESANALAVLAEIGVTPDIRYDNSIYVPEQDESRARAQIAIRGYTGGGFTYDIYNQAGITSTQADRFQWYIYQTQDRCQEMIETFPQVDRAVVNITMQQQSLYTLSSEAYPPSATVKLELNNSLSREQVQGILNILKDSVSGLEEENISISDASGDIKSVLSDEKDGYDQAVAKLKLTDQVRSAYRSAVLSFLQPMFGEGNIQVSVSVALDTNSSVLLRDEYIPINPDDPSDNPLDYESYEAEKIGGEANVVEGVPGVNDNADVPEYAAEDINLSGADSYATRTERDYLVSSVREEIVKEGYDITDMSVAVLINTSTLTDAYRDQLVDLVAMASGTPREKVSVHGMPFNGTETIDITPPEPVDLTNILIITGIAFLALSLIFVILLLLMRRRHKEDRLAAELAVMEASAAPYDDQSIRSEMMPDDAVEEEEFEPIEIPETQEQRLRNQIRDLAQTDPEIVAMLLKTWLTEGNGR